MRMAAADALVQDLLFPLVQEYFVVHLSTITMPTMPVGPTQLMKAHLAVSLCDSRHCADIELHINVSLFWHQY